MLDENWLWKSVGASPNIAPNLLINSNWLSIDSNPLENSVATDESILYDEHAARYEEDKKCIINNNDLIKEEPLQDWLEEKINLSVYDGLPMQIPNDDTENKIQQLVNPYKVIPQPHLQPAFLPTWENAQPTLTENTEESNLLKELEDLLNEKLNDKASCQLESIELGPDFPMRTINQDELYSIVMQDPSLLHPDASSYTEDHSSSVSSPQSSTISDDMLLPTWNNYHMTYSPESQYIRSDEEGEKETKQIQVMQVEEILDDDTNDDIKEDESLPSPSTESNYSEKLSEDSKESSNDDPDWSVSGSKKTVRKYTRNRPYTRKPYVKVSPAERKVRKMEQNKNAATRYRQKKKQATMEIISEEMQLLDKNKDLKEKATDLEREIKYLKNLLRDLYTAKGLIK